MGKKLITMETRANQIIIDGKPSIESSKVSDSFEFKTLRFEDGKIQKLTSIITINRLNSIADFENVLNILKNAASDRVTVLDQIEMGKKLIVEYTNFLEQIGDVDDLSQAEIAKLLTGFMKTELVAEFLSYLQTDVAPSDKTSGEKKVSE